MKRWTDEEIKILKKLRLDPEITTAECSKHLPGRTLKAVKQRISLLGLTRECPTNQFGVFLKWTDDEIDFLESNYSSMPREELKKNLINHDWGSIRRKANSLNLDHRNLRRHTLNEAFFDNWTDESAYIIGYFCSDGCMTNLDSKQKSVAWYSKDVEIIKKFQEALNSTHTISVSKEGLYSLNFSSYRIWSRFYELGIKPRKSYNLEMPSIPEEYFRSFLRGVIDGDGCLHWHDGTPRINILGRESYLISIAGKLHQHLEIPVNKGVFL